MSHNKPENEDLYADLDKFELERSVLKHEENYKELHEKYNSCLKTIETLKNENKLLKKNITNMERNFASLLLTARTELKRKSMQLDELRKEKDDICFRRNTRHYSKRAGQDSSQSPIFDERTQQVAHTREAISGHVKPSSNPFRNYTDQNKEHKEIIDTLHKQYRTSSPKTEKITQIKCKTISLNLEGRSPITLKVEDFREKSDKHKTDDYIANLLTHNEPRLDQNSFKDNENIHLSKTSSGLEICFNKDTTKNLENSNAMFKPVTIYSRRREAEKTHTTASNKEGNAKVTIASTKVPVELKHKSIIPEKAKVNENVSNYDLNHKLTEHNTAEINEGPSESIKEPETQHNKYNDALFDDFLLNEFERNDNISSESKKSEPKPTSKANESKSSAFEDFTDSEQDINKNLSKSAASNTELPQSRPFESVANSKINEGANVDNSEGRESQGLLRKRPRSYDFLDLTNSSANSIELNDVNVTKDLNESQNDLDTSGEDTLFIDVEGLGKTETKGSIQDTDIYNDLSLIIEKENVKRIDNLEKVQNSGIGDVNKELSGDRNNQDLCKDSQVKNVANTISEHCLSGNISSKEVVNSNEKEKSLQEKDITDKNLKKDQCLLKEEVKNIGSNKSDNQDTQSNNCTLSIVRDNAESSGIVDKDSNMHIEKDIKSPETGDEDVEMPLLTIQTDKREGGLEIHPYPPGKFKELFSLHTSKEGNNFTSFMSSKESVQINSINNDQSKSVTEVTNDNETNISSQVTSATHRRDEIISELGIFTAIPKTQIHSQTPTYFGDRAQSNNTNKTLEANTSADDLESDTFDSFNNQLESSTENVTNVKQKQTNTAASKTHAKHSVQETDNENTIEKAQVMFDLYLASPTAPIPSEACLNTSIETKLEKLLGAVGTKKRKSSTPKKTIGSIGRPKKMVGHRIEGFEPITSNKEAIEASKLKNALFEEALKSADSARSGSDATNSSDSLSDYSDKKQEYSKNSEEKSTRDTSLNTEKCLETSIEKSKLDDSKIENGNSSSFNASANPQSRLDSSLDKVATEAPSENSSNENASYLEKNKEKSVEKPVADINQEVTIENMPGKSNTKIDINEYKSTKECEGKSMIENESVQGTPIVKPARKRRNTTYLDNLKSLSLKSSYRANDNDLQSSISHRRTVVDNKDIREFEKNKTTRKAGEGPYQESRKQATNEKNIASESVLSKATSNLTIENLQDDITFTDNTSHHLKDSFMKIINLENPRDPRLEVKRLETCRRNEDYSYLIKLKWTHDENNIFSHSSKDLPSTLELKSRIPPKPCSSFTVLANCKKQSKRDKSNEKHHKKISVKQLPQMVEPDSYKLCEGELLEKRKTGIRKFMQDFCKTIENVEEETVSDSMSICAGDESSNASIGDSSKNSLPFEKMCKTKSFKLSKHESKNKEIKYQKVHAKFNIVPGVNYNHKSDISSTKRHNIEKLSTVKEVKKVDEFKLTESKLKHTEIDIFSEIRDDLDKHMKTTKKLSKSKSVEEKYNQVSKKFAKTVHWENFTKEKQQCKSVSEEITEYLKSTQKVKPSKIKERRKTVDFVTSTGSDLQKRIKIIEDIQICTSGKPAAQNSCDKNDTTDNCMTVSGRNLNIIEKRKARNSLDSKLEGELPQACLADFILKENNLSTQESAETKDNVETPLPNTLLPMQSIPIPLNITENQNAANITDQHDSTVNLLQNTSTPSPQTTGTDTSTSLQVPQYFHTSFMPKRKTVVEVNFCFKNLPVPQSSISATKGNFSTVLRPKRKIEEFHLNTMNKRRKVIYSTMEVEELYKNKKERNLNNISEEELQNAVNMILPRDDYGQTEMKVTTPPKKTPGHKLTARKQKVAAQSVNTLRKSSRIQEKKLAIEREKKLKGRTTKRRKYTKKSAKVKSKNVRTLIKKSKNDDELYDKLFNASSEAEPLNISKNNSNVESNFDSDSEFQKVEKTFREMFEKSPEVFTAINTSNNQFLEAIRCPNDDNMKLIKKTAHKSDEKIKISSSNNSIITSTSKKTTCDTNDKQDSMKSENANSLSPSSSFRKSTAAATKASSRNDKCENKENTAESNSDSGKHDSIVSQDDLNRSSTQNDSVSERKNISVASSSYIIESVSNNVVNVFITRKKKKKKMC